MKEIRVQFNGRGLSSMAGKSFAKGDVRMVPSFCADLCDGKRWVNLDFVPEEEPAAKSQGGELKDPAVGTASEVGGISEEALSEIMVVMPGILANPEQCIGSGAPEVKSLEEASGFNLNAGLRDDLHGYYLEKQIQGGE